MKNLWHAEPSQALSQSIGKQPSVFDVAGPTRSSAKRFDLASSADVTFRSGEQMTLLPEFNIQAGQLAVQIDPALKH